MDSTSSETIVPVAPEEAWEAVTDPEQLSQWLGDDAEIELEPGGDLRVREGDVERAGFVEEVDAPRRLVFWWSVDDGEASRVEVDLIEEADGTRVRVIESRPLEQVEFLASPGPQSRAHALAA